MLNTKKKFIISVLFLVMLFCVPNVALAQDGDNGFDEYGLNAKAKIFIGTLENWDNYYYGLPAIPYNFKSLDTLYIERKWDKLFAPMIYYNPPLGTGAWQQIKGWEYLSGDQLGWTYNLQMFIIYSPNVPIEGAIAVPIEEIGYSGFYFTEQQEWLDGPHGEKIVFQDFVFKPNIHKFLNFNKK